MRERIKSRKGAALEMAILLTVVTFALSTLILTVSLLQHGKRVQAKAELEESILLEQIGEAFCQSATAGWEDSWKESYPEKYVIEIDETACQLTVTEKKSGEVILEVQIELGPEGYRITEWKK